MKSDSCDLIETSALADPMIRALMQADDVRNPDFEALLLGKAWALRAARRGLISRVKPGRTWASGARVV